MPGVADGSFGLEVAALAKLPDEVVSRARSIVEQLKKTEAALPLKASLQVDKEVAVSEEVKALQLKNQELKAYQAQLLKEREKDTYIAAQLANIDCDSMTPKQAFDLIWNLKNTEGM